MQTPNTINARTYHGHWGMTMAIILGLACSPALYAQDKEDLLLEE